MINKMKTHKNSKGFSLAEVMVISAVFLIVVMLSLAILMNGWKIIGKIQSSIMQLRDTRSALARINLILREAESIYEPSAEFLICGSSSSIIFTKNSAELLTPAKEVWGLRFDKNNKALILQKYDPDYPAAKLITEETIIGNGLDSVDFCMDCPQINPSSKIISVHIGALSRNVKSPDIDLYTKIKMK